MLEEVYILEVPIEESLFPNDYRMEAYRTLEDATAAKNKFLHDYGCNPEDRNQLEELRNYIGGLPLITKLKVRGKVDSSMNKKDIAETLKNI